MLDHKIPSGGGIADGERVLDILASHPSAAHFIATKLARRFISDDPPASIIIRAADVFLKTDGSIRETLRAIITSQEFSAANHACRAKVRTPFEYAAAATRALAAETDGDRPMLDWIARMGQPVFGRLTPDGYPDNTEQWLSTGALLNRFNFANALAANRIKGTQTNLSRLLPNADLNTPQASAAQLTQSILSGDLTQRTKAALIKLTTEAVELVEHSKASTPSSAPLSGNIGYLQNVSTATVKTTTTIPAYLSQLLTLIIGAPEFQRR